MKAPIAGFAARVGIVLCTVASLAVGTAARNAAPHRPNFIVILIDDLRYDEFGAGGHPYMKTPHIDRLAHEGAMCVNAFHTTPLCSPNRA